MLFLRSLLFFIGLSVITCVWAIACFLFFPLPYQQRYYWTSRWNIGVIWLAKVFCNINYHIKGMENLPDTPAIVLSKHQSAWETIFYLILMPRPLAFVYKKSLHMIPFFGWAIAMLGMIPIDRRKGAHAFAQVLTQGRERLAKGQWIMIFPEGMRIPVGKTGKYKRGGARLAIATQTPLIPIAVNSGECWPKRAFIKRPGVITVSIGQPITPATNGSDTPTTLMRQVEHWIEAEMRIISPHAYSVCQKNTLT